MATLRIWNIVANSEARLIGFKLLNYDYEKVRVLCSGVKSP